MLQEIIEILSSNPGKAFSIQDLVSEIGKRHPDMPNIDYHVVYDSIRRYRGNSICKISFSNPQRYYINPYGNK